MAQKGELFRLYSTFYKDTKRELRLSVSMNILMNLTYHERTI